MVFRPDTFGKYVLLKRIAVGGMAEVFRARAYGAEGFEKTVAIKRMLPHLSSDDQFVGMFINEAKLTATLNHANIAQIYDFGCIENLYFLSMEYVFGKDLADLIRMLRDRGLAAPVELACHVMMGVLNGLDYAHRKVDSFGNLLNLIHRDTSPHNLIISYEGEVKIVDFGIAKAKSTTVQTTGGVLKGKYSYMSPEQAHGMVMDHRTDIFSLGICFYELLTLTKMFRGTSDLSVLEKVRETSFIPPRELNEAIPEELEKLLLKALEKNPEDRWESAAVWREALDDFLFHSNLHYSASWLSGFMNEIFRDELDREEDELVEEAEIAQQLRTGARRAARMDEIRDTVVLSREEDGSFAIPGSDTGFGPPIREVGDDEFEELSEPSESSAPAFLDTARSATPLGQKNPARGFPARAEPLDDLESDELDSLDELDDIEEVSGEDVVETVGEMRMDGMEDDSMPTMEVSRPDLDLMEAKRIPARRPPIREVNEDKGSEAVTLDERNVPDDMPPPPVGASPVDYDDDYEDTNLDNPEKTGEAALDPLEFNAEAATFKQRRVKQPVNRAPALMEEPTARAGSKGFPWGVVLVVMVLALGAGGTVALWPSLMGEKNGPAQVDGGLNLAGPALPGLPDGSQDPPAEPDAGSPIGAMEPMTPDPKPVDAGIEDEPDAGSLAVLGDPGPAEDSKPIAADPVKLAVVVKAKPPKKHKRRTHSRRKRTNSCPSRGFGAVDVGVSGGWAFVYIDGKKVRTTPLLNYRIKGGRHKVELRSQTNQMVRRWSICLKSGGKVKLLHQ